MSILETLKPNNKENRRPEWLRKKIDINSNVLKTRKQIKDLGLHTICESAACPNIGECYARGTASFLILGDICTRNCGFCNVKHGKPLEIDLLEGIKIGQYMEVNKIKYAVVTSVTRDDLDDGGAKHFVRVVEDIKRTVPHAEIEILVPDFKGDRDSLITVLNSDIAVFSHNLETVKRLYPTVRRGADYDRSLNVLRFAKEYNRRRLSMGMEKLPIKTGIMVGLGETEKELEDLFKDIAQIGVDILTIGQYLRPSRENVSVERYWRPEEFERLRVKAEKIGVPIVVSAPYVRSSYLAEDAYARSKAL